LFFPGRMTVDLSLVFPCPLFFPPQPRARARPGATKERKGLRLRLIPPLWAGAADGRQQHTQGSGWTGAACAGACEERAATSRCRDGPDQRPPLNVHGTSDGATPAGAFSIIRQSRTPPPLAGGVTERRIGVYARVGGRCYSRQRLDVDCAQARTYSSTLAVTLFNSGLMMDFAVAPKSSENDLIFFAE